MVAKKHSLLPRKHFCIGCPKIWILSRHLTTQSHLIFFNLKMLRYIYMLYLNEVISFHLLKWVQYFCCIKTTPNHELIISKQKTFASKTKLTVFLKGNLAPRMITKPSGTLVWTKKKKNCGSKRVSDHSSNTGWLCFFSQGTKSLLALQRAQSVNTIKAFHKPVLDQSARSTGEPQTINHN